MYKPRGFNIDLYHRDNKFNMNDLRYHIRQSILNICTKRLHIPILKRFVQTINKGARCTTHSVQYKSYTILMTRSLMGYIIHSRRSLPHKGSISKRLGANNILLGNPDTGFNKNFLFNVIVHTGTTNTLNRRSITSIALRESIEEGGCF